MNMEPIRFDIKTVSEANQREHWAVKNKRKKSQQSDLHNLWVRDLWMRERRLRVRFPATITFTRYSCKELDADNLAGSFKHIQDQLAKELGIDDGDKRADWQYRQVKTAKREHYFTVEIQEI